MTHGVAEPETFGIYLGEILVQQRGFTAALPAAFAPLATACDRVSTLVDGLVVHLACIVDRDARPDARFGMPPADLLSLASTWVEAVKSAGRRRPTVVVTVYEVGSGVVAADEELRLSAYKGEPRRGVVIRAALVDPERRLVWDNARRFLGRPVAFGWLRRLVAQPRLSRAEMAPAVLSEDLHRSPLLTALILAALAAVFAAEMLFPVAPWHGLLDADIRTLLAFGGVDRTLVVGQGQWWRLVTAPLLHANALHILFNGWALWLIGRLSERLMGPAWFAAVFAVSALSGSALSVLVNPPDMLSVGASGAIVGLFAASFTLSFHVPAGAVRNRLQRATMGTLVPALIPFLSTPSGGRIDYGAHGGGAVGGVVMGLALLLIWPKNSPRPRFALLGGAVAALGLLLAAAAAVPDLANYRRVALAQELFEPFPATDALARVEAPTMIAAKPHDPRARLAHALALIAARDFAGAEAELRTGLAERGLLDLLDPPHYEDRMRVVLGAVLKDEKRPDDARAAAAPACAAEAAGPLRDALARLQLCP